MVQGTYNDDAMRAGRSTTPSAEETMANRKSRPRKTWSSLLPTWQELLRHAVLPCDGPERDCRACSAKKMLAAIGRMNGGK